MAEQTGAAHGIAPVQVIDIAAFPAGGTAARAIADELTAACEGVGFFQITGHGVDPDLIAAFDAVTREFFALPPEEKRRAASPIGNRYQGYAELSTGPGDQPGELESFGVCRYDTIEEAIAAGYPADAGETMLAAIWPERPTAMRAVWRAYFAAMESLVHRLLAVFELALDLPAGWFAPSIDRDQSTLAANHYANQVVDDAVTPFRFKPHVDGSILTVLYQDDGPSGLQLHQRGRGWRSVAPRPGTFVVNLGDLMERWTNDRFVATPHRVLRPDGHHEARPRLSAPFFLKPNHDAVIAPIPHLVPAGEAPRYAPITGRGWLARDHADLGTGYDRTVRFADLERADPSLAHDLGV